MHVINALRATLFVALATLFVLLLEPSTALAQTTIPGGSVANQTWSPAGSPYILQGDVVVPAGAFLDIQPGTVIQAGSTDGLSAGLDASRIEITVDGTLTANGTAAQPIVFTGITTTAGSWYGIVLGAGSTSVSITNASIQYATNAISTASTGTVSVSDVQVRNGSASGIVVSAGSPTFANLVIAGGSTGISVTGSGSPTFTNGAITGASSAGVSISPTSGSTTNLTRFAISGSTTYGVNISTTAPGVWVNLTEDTIALNGTYGVYVYGPTTLNVSIRNSIVAQQTYGIYRTTAVGMPVIAVNSTDVWGNTSADYTSATAGSGSFSSNPLFVSTSNLRLTSNSPARFASDTGSDLGALQYISDPTPGLHGTLWTDTHLTTASSPYAIAGDVTVPPGVTLTIDPGVTMIWSASADIMGSGANITRGELIVRGRLVADGTASSRITLASNSGAVGSWYGVELLSTTSAPSLSYATITAATNAITSTGVSGSAIDQITINPSTIGILVTGGAPTFTNLTVSGSTGISVTGGSPTFVTGAVSGASTGSAAISVTSSTASTTTIDGLTVSGFVTYGINVTTTTAAAVNVNVVRTTIRSSSPTYGVYVSGPSSLNVSIRDSIISNATFGVYRVTAGGASVVSVSYSDVWSTSTSGSEYSNVTPGAGTFSSNPLYVSTSNLRLTSNSPCRFAGMSGNDIGALPYVSDPTPGLYGTLWTNTTLTAAGSPYALAGDLTVPPGVTLTIEPGVTLTFALTDIMRSGDIPLESEFRVYGTLAAAGTPTAPITLNSTTSAMSSWIGVYFFSNTSPPTLTNARIVGANVGLRYSGTASDTIADVTFTACAYPIQVNAGSPTFQRIAMDGAYDGITVLSRASATLTDLSVLNSQNAGITINPGGSSTSSNVSIVNALIVDSTRYGVNVAPTSGATVNVNITNSTIHSNGTYGVYAGGSGSTTIAILNSLVTQQGYGVYRSVGTISVSYSDVWGNTTNNYSTGVTPGIGTMSVNPLYISAPTNLHVQAGSLTIDRGTPLGAPDHDRDGVMRPIDGDMFGAADYDMGAYEYFPVPVCGNGVREGTEVCDDGTRNGTYGGICNATCTGPGPRCGDGTRNGPEACDDGNANETDACLSTCVAARCGDGFVRAGVEACDDGNAINTDGCTTLCTAPRCGDGFVQAGEMCDDGNTSDLDACTTACVVARCGDGFVQTGVEACDDANANDNDACLSTCVAARCGDGITQTGVESCDDGNSSNTDACTNTCSNARCGDGFTEAGVEMCDDGNSSNTDACTNACVTARCGDGYVLPGIEVCDDGANNGMTGYCNSTCTMAAGPRCGNGVREGSEECDDGNTSDTDACTNACANARCGDGLVRFGVEQCDDANASNTDACLNTCLSASCGDSFVRAGVELCDEGANNGTYGHCSALCNGPGMRCGDGMTNGPEECDDANASNTDGCLNVCVNARCGDAFVRAGVEMCDDGNAIETDSCTTSCEPARCGDGHVQAGVETCDDGNTMPGDGCSAMCTNEVIDAGVDAGSDAGDAEVDAGDDASDAEADAGDAEADVGDDASDVHSDAGDDASDAVADASVDANDAAVDADVDGGADVVDAADDSSSDANVGDGSNDTGVEAGNDASAASDARGDVSGDAGRPSMNAGCGCRAAGSETRGRSIVPIALGLALALALRRRSRRDRRDDAVHLP